MKNGNREQAIYVPEHGDLARKVEAWRTLGKTIVLTQGVWDMWHTGHIRYISRAGEQGDVLVVAVDSDHLVRQRKGPDRPFDSYNERVAAVQSHWAVDAVCKKDSVSDPYQILKVVRPDVFVISQTTGPEIQKDIKKFEEWAGRVENLEIQSSTTTTAKLRRLKSGVLNEFRGRFDQLFQEFEAKLADGGSDGIEQVELLGVEGGVSES